jgi:hypothetical protein
MGIGSLFVLSLGLSVLVEVVRMLNVGKKGKPARRSPDQASLAGLPFGALAAPCRQATAAVLWSLWVSTALHGSISVSSRSVWVSRRAEGAPKARQSGLDYEIRKQVTRSCLTVCLVVRERSWHHLAHSTV